ncbi:hypothetical protein TNCV_3802041 [Trichonephila clavipes]|nr:hypothetical protein TNCV_3802041 [Trichonephila clavipes]
MVGPVINPKLLEENCRSCRENKYKEDGDDVQELQKLFHNQEIAIDELTEMHEQEQGIEELESSIRKWELDRRSQFKELQSLENIDSQRRAYFFQQNKE